MIDDVSMLEAPSALGGETTTRAEFEELLIAYQPRILGYIKSVVANHHEAEDLLQRTNVILWRKRSSFEAGSNFRAWSFAIARLEVFNQLRQQRRDQRAFQEHEEQSAIDFLLPAENDDTEALVALRNCLKRLPSRDQELIQMRYASDRTLGEYAKNLNRSPGTLKARLFQIRENLRKSIEEQLQRSDSQWGPTKCSGSISR